jgi:hypothetical protein
VVRPSRTRHHRHRPARRRYTGGTAKIAEHGGDDLQDRNVPILVSLPGLRYGQQIDAPVETTEIARPS